MTSWVGLPPQTGSIIVVPIPQLAQDEVKLTAHICWGVGASVVGLPLGTPEGTADGDEVGTRVGTTVGALLGTPLGAAVRSIVVGRPVGGIVSGTAVDGDELGRSVGTNVAVAVVGPAVGITGTGAIVVGDAAVVGTVVGGSVWMGVTRLGGKLGTFEGAADGGGVASVATVVGCRVGTGVAAVGCLDGAPVGVPCGLGRSVGSWATMGRVVGLGVGGRGLLVVGLGFGCLDGADDNGIER